MFVLHQLTNSLNNKLAYEIINQIYYTYDQRATHIRNHQLRLLFLSVNKLPTEEKEITKNKRATKQWITITVLIRENTTPAISHQVQTKTLTKL